MSKCHNTDPRSKAAVPRAVPTPDPRSLSIQPRNCSSRRGLTPLASPSPSATRIRPRPESEITAYSCFPCGRKTLAPADYTVPDEPGLIARCCRKNQRFASHGRGYRGPKQSQLLRYFAGYSIFPLQEETQ